MLAKVESENKNEMPDSKDFCCFCSFVPNYVFKAIAESEAAPSDARSAASESLSLSQRLQKDRASSLPTSTINPDTTGGNAGFVAPHVLEAIAGSEKAGSQARESAQRTLEESDAIRKARQTGVEQEASTPGPLQKNRRIYDCDEWASLPGKLARREGQNPVKKDRDDSIDNGGMDLYATVHYEKDFNNAFWNGQQMVFGDGDGIMFDEFTNSLDVIAHELTHGVTGYTAGLQYQGQSGALNESISDVFACMVEQWHFNQTVDKADWSLGQGIFPLGRKGSALRSMSDPGSAYDDPIIGKDPQRAHMNNIYKGPSDNGGVHINSGIPNKAFYLVCKGISAKGLDANSWGKAGKIWYETITGTEITPRCDFKLFAQITVTNAAKFGNEEKDIVKKAWEEVGIVIGS